MKTIRFIGLIIILALLGTTLVVQAATTSSVDKKTTVAGMVTAVTATAKDVSEKIKTRTFYLEGTITTNGPTKVQYHWKQSSGEIIRAEELTFSTASKFTVNYNWDVPSHLHDQKLDLTLEVVSPNLISSPSLSVYVIGASYGTVTNLDLSVSSFTPPTTPSSSNVTYTLTGVVTANGPLAVKCAWYALPGLNETNDLLFDIGALTNTIKKTITVPYKAEAYPITATITILNTSNTKVLSEKKINFTVPANPNASKVTSANIGVMNMYWTEKDDTLTVNYMGTIITNGPTDVSYTVVGDDGKEYSTGNLHFSKAETQIISGDLHYQDIYAGTRVYNCPSCPVLYN